MHQQKSLKLALTTYTPRSWNRHFEYYLIGFPGNFTDFCSGSFFLVFVRVVLLHFFSRTSTNPPLHSSEPPKIPLQNSQKKPPNRLFIDPAVGARSHVRMHTCPEISRKCPGSFREISWKFPGNVLEMSWKFPGNFLENFLEISRNRPRIFPEFSPGDRFPGDNKKRAHCNRGKRLFK